MDSVPKSWHKNPWHKRQTIQGAIAVSVFVLALSLGAVFSGGSSTIEAIVLPPVSPVLGLGAIGGFGLIQGLGGGYNFQIPIPQKNDCSGPKNETISADGVDVTLTACHDSQPLVNFDRYSRQETTKSGQTVTRTLTPPVSFFVSAVNSSSQNRCLAVLFKTEGYLANKAYAMIGFSAPVGTQEDDDSFFEKTATDSSIEARLNLPREKGTKPALGFVGWDPEFSSFLKEKELVSLDQLVETLSGKLTFQGQTDEAAVFELKKSSQGLRTTVTVWVGELKSGCNKPKSKDELTQVGQVTFDLPLDSSAIADYRLKVSQRGHKEINSSRSRLVR